jgi:hypothetical protein
MSVGSGLAVCGAVTLLLGVATAVRAQDDFGTTAAPTLRIPAGTRPVALGDAYVAVRGDELSVFYNAGSLASAAGPSAAASYQSFFVGSDLVTLSGAVPLGPGVAALGVHALDFGSVDEVVEDPSFAGQTGRPTGNRVGANELVATAGYGIAPIGRLGIGAAVKLIRTELAEESGTAVAADIGIRVEPWEGRAPTFGVSVLNVGGDLELAGRSDPLPRTLRVGTALDMGRPAEGFGGLIAAEVVAVRGGASRLALGVETNRGFGGVRLAGRAGVQATSAEETLADAVTFGASLEIGSFRLDYAHVGFDVVGAAHRFGLRWAGD